MAKRDFTEFRAMRMAAGLTISALADEVGVTAGTIFNWEHGKSSPAASKIPKLAKALNIEPNDVVAIISAS